MQQMNNDDSIQTNIEENDNSIESESEKISASTRREPSISISRLSSSVKRKSSNTPLKSKRFCKFNKEWMKLSNYASFLQECRTDSSFAHCSICDSNFSIANGGKYLIDRHLEQMTHKRLFVCVPSWPLPIKIGQNERTNQDKKIWPWWNQYVEA